MAVQSTQPTTFRSWIEVFQTRHQHVRMPVLLGGSFVNFHAVTRQSQLGLSRSILTTLSKDGFQDSRMGPHPTYFTGTPIRSTSNARTKHSSALQEKNVFTTLLQACSQRSDIESSPSGTSFSRMRCHGQLGHQGSRKPRNSGKDICTS